MKPIIGISGLAGSGKDTTAGLIIEELEKRGYDFSQYAFADPIRDFARNVFGFSMNHMLSRDTKEVPVKRKYDRKFLVDYAVIETRNLLRKYKSNTGIDTDTIEDVIMTRRIDDRTIGKWHHRDVCHAMAEFLIDDILWHYQYKPNIFVRLFEKLTGKDNVRFSISPRTLTQKIGTEYFRNIVNKKFWTAIAPTHEVVISDIRFPEEERFVKDNDGIVLSVYNPLLELIGEHYHESEQYVNAIKADRVIVNDGQSLELLRHAVIEFLDDLEGRQPGYMEFDRPVEDSHGVAPYIQEVKEA